MTIVNKFINKGIHNLTVLCGWAMTWRKASYMPKDYKDLCNIYIITAPTIYVPRSTRAKELMYKFYPFIRLEIYFWMFHLASVANHEYLYALKLLLTVSWLIIPF